MSNRLSPVLDHHGDPFVHVNGKPRPELLEAMLASQSPSQNRRAKSNYDAARDTVEYQAHLSNVDSLDADSANSKTVRDKLRNFSRYENGSNAIYNGITGTHCNWIVGEGPTLRMLTGNRVFNQLVEREFFKWCEKVQLRRKLWCMAHARIQDGEAFAVLQNNPGFSENGVQLDVMLIEAEQCQTPFMPFMETGYIDGIKFDEFNNILWYDVLPTHPGSANQFAMTQEPVRVSPRDMLHWFKLDRPGVHRNVPAMTSSLNVGASARRMREATLAAAETAADLNVMLTTQLTPDTVTDPMAPFSTLPIQKRMMTAAPSGWEAHHFKSEHPNATYESFNRGLDREQGRPIHQPVNVVQGDSSNYSFASGKLDTLSYWLEILIERSDCNDLVMNRIFAAWFREWTILIARRDIPPNHQWDWPAKPIIDAVAEAKATDTKLKNGTMSLRDAYTDSAKDFEDQLSVMAEDTFGVADETTIAKMRQIVTLKNTPAQAIPVVAQILGIELPASQSPAASEASASVTQELAERIDEITEQLAEMAQLNTQMRPVG